MGIHEFGGETLTPGTYHAGTALNFAHGTTTVTLVDQNKIDPIFLFQAVDTKFNLTNGAKVENIIRVLSSRHPSRGQKRG